MTITGRQIREARILLKLDRSTLARRTALSPTVIERAEASDGEPSITMAQETAIRRVLVGAGVEFTADPPGVRLGSPSIPQPRRGLSMPEPAEAAEGAASNVITELTSEIVGAYVAHNALPPADVPEPSGTVHAALSGLSRPPEPIAKPQRPVPPVPIRKSIGDDYLVSLEDGKRYTSLRPHLAKHGLTPAEYRAKWGLPHDYPMVAPAHSRALSVMAKKTGLGSLRRKR